MKPFLPTVLEQPRIVLENLTNLEQLPPTGTILVIGILRLRVALALLLPLLHWCHRVGPSVSASYTQNENSTQQQSWFIKNKSTYPQKSW